MSYILIVGAKSDIAKAIAREYAKNGYDLYLAARKSEVLKEFANDIVVRTNRDVQLVDLDILDFDAHKPIYEALPQKPLGVVTAVGYLGDQEVAQTDTNECFKIIDTNFKGVVSLLNIVADDYEKQRAGFIVGISSVAGDRGRKSNYLYGAAKSAFSTYLSGLRNRLHESQVNVLTVKPGFVATQMTEGMDLPEKLTAKPEEVAVDIYKAQQNNKNILYTKWFWSFIMLVIKLIPESIFKKMSI